MTKGSSSRSSSSSSSANDKDLKRPEPEEVRYYPFGGGFVTFDEFLELPRGRDITEEDIQGELQGEEGLQEERLRVYRTFQTKEEHEKANRWNLKEMPNTEVPFKLLSTAGKVEWVLSAFIKFCAIWGVLYLFIIALGVMGNAFKVLGGKSSGKTFRESELLSNPLAGLSIGILATVLMQSSSTTTSIVISMAASDLVTVKNAAYLVMGANIGTSVTNTIVSIAHLNSPDQYRRAFTAAVFHDMFNWLTVSMFLPLEASSGFLVELAASAVDSMNLGDKQEKTEFIKKITKPASGRIVSVDKDLIEKIAEAKTSEEVSELEKQSIIKKKSGFVLRDTPQSDDEAGVLLLFVSITMLCTCLLLLVKLLQSVLKGKVAVYTRKVLNLDFQNKYLKMCGGLDSYILLLVGTGITILVQSSSVFTSTLTPLVGIGLIHVEKVVALTHGANIGTTVTGIISALSGDNVDTGMRVALEHVFFNCLGTTIWFVIWPLRPVPLAAAKFLGETAANLKWFPVAYIITGFVVVPVVIVGLSIPGWEVLLGIGLPVFLIIIFFAGWLWVRRNRADMLSRGGCLRSAKAPCGCDYPNWMQVWGGDRSKDNVDMEELRRKEAIAEAEEAGEWPMSPMAWGLAILAFLALLLAIPTAQWRRIRYAKEERGRKEYGFGLWEVCNDDFKKDAVWATRPPLCNQAQINDCAKDLVRSCSTNGWSSDVVPTSLEDDQYESAWQTCSKLGCRVWDWLQYCPEIPECGVNKDLHTNRCAAVVYNYKFFNHNQMDAKGVEYIYPLDDSTEPPAMVTTPAHANVFFSGTASSYKVSTFPVAPKPLNDMNSVNAPNGLTSSCADCTETCASSTDRKVCTDAPPLTGLAYDSCTGELIAVSGNGPTLGCTDGSAFIFEEFAPSMSKMSLTKAKESSSHVAEIGATTPLKRTDNIGGITYATGLPNNNAWGSRYSSGATASTCAGNANSDAQGLDLGDVQILRQAVTTTTTAQDGTTTTTTTTPGIYVGSDQYGARIVFWDDAGEILATYVPVTGANVANTIEILPAEFANRDRTSGRVTMAINSDKTKMAVCAQVAMDTTAYLRSSPVVRCALLDISDYSVPLLTGVKVVLQNEVSAEYTEGERGVASAQSEVEFVSAQWLSGDKVLFLEQGKFTGNNLGGGVYVADFATGDNINTGLIANTVAAIEGAAVRAKASVTAPSQNSESDYEAHPQAYQILAAVGARPVDMEKVMDLNDIDEGDRESMASAPIGSMLVPNEHNIVLGEDNKFGATGSGYAKVHVVNLKNELKMSKASCSASSSSSPSADIEARTVKATTRCRDIEDVCPEGDLAGDFRTVAGLVVTACILLFIGLVCVIAYTCTKKAALGIYVTAGCFSVCWILLLAAWVHVDTLEDNTYTCMFQDESLRGGLVLIKGKLVYITMESYSWAFAIFAWGMMTMSLAAVWHHVISLLCFPDTLAQKKKELEDGEDGSSNAPDKPEEE